MERLTEWWDQFERPSEVCDEYKRDCCEDCPIDCPWYIAARDKLYRYEKTGLEPKQVQELKEKQTGWIPVEERLPEDNRMVLVTCQTKKGIRNVNRAYCMDGVWHGSGTMSSVIAWRPLPEPYGTSTGTN